MLRIDFISDINCPWCALGLASLEAAIAQLSPEISIDLHIQPFELNPDLGAEGIELVPYLKQKYGMSQQQVDQVHATLRERGAQVGFVFGERKYSWNSFDAHRLIYWAAQECPAGSQLALKRALMQAYQGQGRNIADKDELLKIVGEAGLDQARAQAILSSDEFSHQVRSLEHQWQGLGINSVPSLVFDNKHLLQGAQPVETMVQAISELAKLPG